MSARPTCPVCRRPVQLEVVNFVSRDVQQRIYQCGAVELVGTSSWPTACPDAMAEFMAAEGEIAMLRAKLERLVSQ